MGGGYLGAMVFFGGCTCPAARGYARPTFWGLGLEIFWFGVSGRDVLRMELAKRLIAGLLLPIVFFSGPVSVLCLGADGHVALELGSGGDCEPAPCCLPDQADPAENAGACHSDEPVESHSHPEPACCGGCVDIILQLEEARLVSSQVTLEMPVLYLSLLAWLPSLVVGPEALLLPRFQPANLPPPQGVLEAYRTVSLLI